MRQSQWLSFALGVTTVLSLGAATAHVRSTPSAGISISDSAITFPDGTVQTTAAGRSRRAFYLTSSLHNGALAGLACATGFHFASMWEIFDVGGLRYATDAEGGSDVFRRADSGVGPPTDAVGWVRTGYDSEGANAEGEANCLAWTAPDEAVRGTRVEIEESWGQGTGSGDPSGIVVPFDSSTAACNSGERVWCVQD